MDKSITKVQETLSERLIMIDVLVDKLHEDQEVTKVSHKSESHQAPILDICEDVDQKYKKLGDTISKLKEKFDYYKNVQKCSNLRLWRDETPSVFYRN
jgi:hypothetical protein